MSRVIKRVVASLLSLSAILFAAWTLGFDFNERGLNAFITYVISLYAAGLGYFFIGDEL